MPQHASQDTTPVGLKIMGGLFSAAATAVGAWIGYSALLVNHHLPLLPAIEDAEREQFISRYTGLISYYRDATATGRPLLLLHSINAAASAYEMRPLFNVFRTTRPVYALDLPGFGFSERSDRPYSPELYVQAILDFITNVIGQPADVVTLSLSSEFAALAALERPDAFNTLTMISPSGFTRRGDKVASQRARQSGTSDVFYNLFSFPLWTQAFYDLVASPASIRYFLRQSFVGPVDPALAEYGYATSHQPGARYAPLYFVSGKLFTPNIRERAYEHLAMPMLVVYDQDPFVRFDTLDETAQTRANWYTSRITPTRGLPQFERLPETVQALQDFWDAQDPLKPVEPSAMAGWAAQDSQ
jgi:pimeloyl-ACP methyl ester carboxylesterase